jgi:hypothetical protein
VPLLVNCATIVDGLLTHSCYAFPMSAKCRSYLLRMWCEDSRARSGWRFTLTGLGDDRQRGFATLDKLADYLQAQMAEIVASEVDAPEETRKE